MNKTAKERLLLVIFSLASGISVFLGSRWGIADPNTLALLFGTGLSFAISALFVRFGFEPAAALMVPVLTAAAVAPKTPQVLAGFALAYVFALLGFRRISLYAESGNDFSVVRILRAGFPLVITAIAVTVAVFYYINNASGKDNALIPKPVFDIVWPYAVRVQSSLPLPNFGISLQANSNEDETVREFFDRNIAGAEAEYGRKFSKSERNALMAEARKNAEESFGVALKDEEKVKDAFFRIMNDKTGDLVSDYSAFLPFALSLGVFFAVRTIFIPLGWLVVLFSGIIVKLGLKSGVIKRLKAEKMVETFTL